MACVIKVTRSDLQKLMRQGWVLVGDGKDRRQETQRQRRERRRKEGRTDLSELTNMNQRERDPGIKAAENHDELSALLYLNGAERKDDVDTALDFDSYVSLNVTLETFHRLLDGKVIKWGDRYGRPLYVDSEGDERQKSQNKTSQQK